MLEKKHLVRITLRIMSKDFISLKFVPNLKFNVEFLVSFRKNIQYLPSQQTYFITLIFYRDRVK